VIEIITGLLFLLIFNLQPSIFNTVSIVHLLYYWVIASLFIVIAVYDFNHKIIPNGFVYAFIILSFLHLFINVNSEVIYPSAMDFLAGPILAIPFVLVWFFSKGRWMGLGDGKLALGIGWMLGILKGISAMLIAFWVGAIIGITLLFLEHKTITMKSEIPLGPFLILGALIVFLFNIDIIDYLLSF